MGTGVARHFEMWRDRDVSGVSGEGLVAEGWQYDAPIDLRFPDGSLLAMGPGWCKVVWYGEHRSVVLWRSFEDAVAVHGHGGATRFVWTGREDPLEPLPGRTFDFDRFGSPQERIRKLDGE